MPDYLQLEFQDITTDQSEILVAELSESGFQGFEETENTLKAFISVGDFNEDVIKNIAQQLQVQFSKSIIKETNWNHVWESNFQPVKVDDFVLIRAGFHEQTGDTKHEIIITPKMSFGTGHHATTYMMIQQMRTIDFVGKSVLDFGTGTGILAILAEKMGAATVLALDNDDWSISNSEENIAQNRCTRVHVQKADSARLDRQFDIVLTNINKNVITDNLQFLVKQLASCGVLVMSGLLTGDEADILKETERVGMMAGQRLERHNWLSLKLSGK